MMRVRETHLLQLACGHIERSLLDFVLYSSENVGDFARGCETILQATALANLNVIEGLAYIARRLLEV
jgi:hypothetical protein